MNRMIGALTAVFIAFMLIAPAFAKTGDVNGDGRVDLKDIALVARHFGSTPGQPTWDARCDLNGDGQINMLDLAILARHFGT